MTALSSQINAQDIQDAFVKELFVNYYEPRVLLSNDQEVVGVEAFIQINHPEKDIIPPRIHYAYVKELGLQMDLFKATMAVAVKDLKQWQTNGHPINLSVKAEEILFEGNDLYQFLNKVVPASGVHPNDITLIVLKNDQGVFSSSIKDSMIKLRMSGYNLVLGNFFTSAELEEQMEELPIDEIQLGRDTVYNLTKKNKAKSTAARAFHIANSLGTRVSAKGILEEAQETWLQMQGCDIGQGPFWGPAMDFQTFNNTIFENPEQWRIHKGSERLRLLIVEDDMQYQMLLSEALSELFEIEIATSCAQATSIFDSFRPNVVIMDVFLPDGSGLELSRTLSQMLNDDSFSLLYISGDDNPKTRIEAYEGGASDFINKPIALPELVAKMGRIASYQTRKRELIIESHEVHNAAMQSMKEAALYGDVVRFFSSLISCRDERSIAQALFRFMGKKSLCCSVQFRSNERIVSFDQNETVCSPIEINMFELLKEKGRLHDFGQRTIVNDRHVSIIVKKMPKDPIERGSARDYIAVLIEGIETRYRDVLRQRVLESVFQQLEELAVELATVVKSDNSHKSEMLEKFSLELQMSFHVLDLTVEQETHINKIVEGMLHAKEETELNTADVSDRITRLASLLSETLDELDQTDDSQDHDDSGDSVELF